MATALPFKPFLISAALGAAMTTAADAVTVTQEFSDRLISGMGLYSLRNEFGGYNHYRAGDVFGGGTLGVIDHGWNLDNLVSAALTVTAVSDLWCECDVSDTTARVDFHVWSDLGEDLYMIAFDNTAASSERPPFERQIPIAQSNHAGLSSGARLAVEYGGVMGVGYSTDENFDFGGGVTINYTLSLTFADTALAPVPLPATAPLLVLAGAGLFAARRLGAVRKAG